MSNLLSIHNSKNQIGIGTNSISVSSSLTIKEDSKKYIVFNTGNNSIDTYRPIELEETTTLSTVKTHSISSPKLLYISSNSIINSLSFSSSANTHLMVSNVGVLGFVDRTGPTMIITSTTSGITNGITTNNSFILLTFTSNKTITNFTSEKIIVSNGSISNFSATSSTVYTAKFTPSSDGVCAISVGVNTFTDVNGNNNTETTQFNWTYDSIAPTITSVTSTTTNNSYGVGNSINITLTFTKNVTLSGGNILVTLETGTTDRIVSISSVSDSTTAVGTYIVQAGDTSSDLTVKTIGLSGGTLQDIAGNAMIFNIGTNLAASSAIVIDTTAPTITSITSTTNNGSYKVGDPDINITINFSESVTLTGSILVTLETGTTDRTVSISDFSNLTTKAGTYQIIAGDTTSALTVKTIELVSGATLKDAAGNDISSFNIGTNLTASSSIIIDTIAPTITSVTSTTVNGTYGIGDSINITINFSENVTLTSGTITITLETGTTDRTVTINSVSNSNTASGNYTVQAGDTSSDLTVKTIAISVPESLEDITGNAMSSFDIGTNLAASSAIVIDSTAPTITTGPSLTSSNSYSTLATSSDTVTLTFTTSETIKTPTISINGQTPSISSSGNTWTATYSPQTTHNVGPILYSITYEDLAGNSGSTISNTTSTIAHYETNDLRHYMWKQNLQTGSEARGSVGYTYLRGYFQFHSSLAYAFAEDSSWGGDGFYVGIPGVSTIVWESAGMSGDNDIPPQRNTSTGKAYIFKIVFDQRNVSGGTDYRTYVDTPLANVNYRIYCTRYSLNTSSTTVLTTSLHTEVGTQHPWFTVSSNYITQKRRTFTNTQKLKITRSTKSTGSTFGGYWNINLHDIIGHNNSSHIYKVSLISLSTFNYNNKYGYLLTDIPAGHTYDRYSTHGGQSYYGNTFSYDDDFDLLTGYGGNFF